MWKYLIALSLLLFGCGSPKSTTQYFESPDTHVIDSINQADGLGLNNYRTWNSSVYLSVPDTNIIYIYRTFQVKAGKTYIMSITTLRDSIIKSNVRIEKR